MNKRFFVYPDELASNPLDPYGCDTRIEAEELALMAYGQHSHADIRHEYPNELAVAA